MDKDTYTNEQLLTANYYDRHDFINGSLVKQATNQNLASDLKAVVTNSRGFQTGTISKDTDGELLVSVFYHSIEGLVVESKETLPGKAFLCQRTTYTYTKKPATITSTITKGSVGKNIVQTNSYNPNNDMIGSIALTYSYNGNQIKSISDKAGSLLYNGSFDFKDGVNADTEYFYDANGALTKDLNKGINSIEYDVLGNLKCITFCNGNKTKYVYDASGAKLRTIHESAATNTTDYAGNFISKRH